LTPTWLSATKGVLQDKASSLKTRPIQTRRDSEAAFKAIDA
jgi:hypothetical protein